MPISGKSDAVAESAHRWIELIPDATLLCDDAGIILTANSRAGAFFGAGGSRLSGVPVLWTIPTDSRDTFLLSWNNRLQLARPGGENSALTMGNSHGRDVPVLMTIDRVRSSGRSLFALVFRDAPVPGTRNAPRDSTMSSYLSSVRHDVRNPLSGIAIYTDVLLRNGAGNLDETQIDQLVAIRDAAGDLARLINNIEVPRAVPLDRSA